MPICKRGDTYWYELNFKGTRLRESTHPGNPNVARGIEADALIYAFPSPALSRPLFTLDTSY
jgi:hypothetical protein